VSICQSDPAGTETGARCADEGAGGGCATTIREGVASLIEEFRARTIQGFTGKRIGADSPQKIMGKSIIPRVQSHGKDCRTGSCNYEKDCPFLEPRSKEVIWQN